ncbi:MAG: Ig-like domain-containing protein [Cyanothece sp. SIO1E1]|nr:Ig-like domain-containing protein [Cyanothece sp. SIO1E1]
MSSQKNVTAVKAGFQPLDRVALTIMAVLIVIIGVMVTVGDHANARVRDFSWQGKKVGVEDIAFVLSFNRPMDQASVEQNLRLDALTSPTDRQPISGKPSWAGRRMAYTLAEPLPYGTTFELQLQGGRDLLSQGQDNPVPMQPFLQQFRTRDRAFAYLGVEGEEEGRLILSNLTRQEQHILTPKDSIVMDFEPYPQGEKILFSALDRRFLEQPNLSQEIYAVTTGVSAQAAEESRTQQPGQINKILDGQNYQNSQFDLSQDGQVILVRRTSQSGPAGFKDELWILRPDAKPKPLEIEVLGNFVITPDSQGLALLKGKGTEILPLPLEKASEVQPKALDFLPDYGRVLDFARDGSAAAMVNFNQDDPTASQTQSLFLVTNRGTEQELLQTNGDILSAQFEPQNKTLYCLFTQSLGEGYDDYLELAPHLAAIDLETAESTILMPLFTQDGSVAVMVKFAHRPDQPTPSLAIITSEGTENVLEITDGDIVGTHFDLETQTLYGEFSADDTTKTNTTWIPLNSETSGLSQLQLLPLQRSVEMSLSPDGTGILFDQAIPGAETASSKLWLLPLTNRTAQDPFKLPPTLVLPSGGHPQWLP